MRQSKRYEIYDHRTGLLVFAGTANECGEFVRIGVGTIRAAAEIENRVLLGKYTVVDVSNEVKNTDCDTQSTSPAQQWDEFITPIREKFGIPVYRGEAK